MDSMVKFANFKEKLNSSPFNKIWVLDSFDKSSQRKTIMAEMPDYDVYLANKAKISKKDVGIEFDFMCIEPFLNRQQEYHLFRKYNFLKYQYKKLIEKTTLKANYNQVVDVLENYYTQMNELKQRIALSNARLVMNIAKKMNVLNLETALSDGCLGLVIAVDCFDFRRNIKFITYGYLVIKDYIRKQKCVDLKHLAKVNLDDLLDITDDGCDEENMYQEELKSIVNNCLDASMTSRQKDILVDYYGLNGKNRLTLEEISQKQGVSKERIRQIRLDGEEQLKTHGILSGKLLSKFWS